MLVRVKLTALVDDLHSYVSLLRIGVGRLGLAHTHNWCVGVVASVRGQYAAVSPYRHHCCHIS